MKTENRATLIGILIGFAIAAIIGAVVPSPKQQRPEGYTAEDSTVRDRAFISKKEDAWRVAMIITNSDDIAILKVTPPGAANDSPTARYATTTDSTITNGMSVRLIEVGCFKSPGDVIALGTHPTSSYIAIRDHPEATTKHDSHSNEFGGF